MTVYRDKTRRQWCYTFRVNGLRHAARLDPIAVKSRRAAEEAEAAARTRAKLEGKLPRAADLTFGQIVNDLSEIWQHEKNWPDKRRIARELLEFFGPATAVAAIDGARIQDYVAYALARPRLIWLGGPSGEPCETGANWKADPRGRTRSPARVNRCLVLLRAVFKRAMQTRDPLTRRRAIDDLPPIPKLTEAKHRANPVPDAVIKFLFSVLPPHVRDATRATMHFGFRRSEAFSLTVAQIDFQAGGIRLEAAHVKDKEDAFLPGSRDAMAFLVGMARQAKKRGTPYLFAYRRVATMVAGEPAVESWRPIKSPKTAWARAMGLVEAKFGRRWRWHDLRAAYITFVALNSGPLAAQKLARHSDFETTQAYIEIADDILRAAAERASRRPALRLVKTRPRA